MNFEAKKDTWFQIEYGSSDLWKYPPTYIEGEDSVKDDYDCKDEGKDMLVVSRILLRYD